MLLTNYQTFNQLFELLCHAMIAVITQNIELFIEKCGMPGVVILCISELALFYAYFHFRIKKTLSGGKKNENL